VRRNVTTMTAEQQAYALANAPTTPVCILAKAIGRDASTLARWLKRRGVECPRLYIERVEQTHEQYVIANWLGQSDAELSANTGVGAETIRKMRLKLGLKRPQPKRGGKPNPVKAKGKPKPAHTNGYFRPRSVEQPKDTADRAAEHIASYDRTPVFRIADDGKPHPKGKLWRYGTTRLTTEQMLAKAYRKGFDPDAWRRLAA